MSTLYSLWGQCQRQPARILYLYPIIIYGNARSQVIFLQLSMAQGIRQGFPQRLCRYFQLFLLLKAHNFSALRQVFEQKCHTRIKQVEKVTVSPSAIHKLILVRTTETGQLQPHLRIASNTFSEQRHSTIQHLSVPHQTPLSKQRLDTFRLCRRGHPSTLYT